MRRVLFLLVAVLTLAACGGGGGGPATPATDIEETPNADETEEASAEPAATEADTAAGAGGEADVEIAQFKFVPDAYEVAVGQPVTWINRDKTLHNVTFEGDHPSSEDFNQGGTFETTFDTAGDYPYICSIHPFMTATVTVTG
jgi:plastocyanin